MRRKSNVVSLTCCGLPILAGVLAWLGIGASQLEFFARYQIWFIAIAVIALLFGFYQLYFRERQCIPKDTSLVRNINFNINACFQHKPKGI